MNRIKLIVCQAAAALLVACGGGAGGGDNAVGTQIDNPPATTTSLSINKNVEGGRVVSTPAGIDCGGTCAKSFAVGTTVTLSAEPAAGYDFVGWSGSSALQPCIAGAPCDVKLDSPQTVTATFSPQAATQYDLGLSVSGKGSVSSVPQGLDACSADCSARFNAGTAVTLTATAASGYAFAGWSGSGIACPASSAQCVVTMSSARSVQAVFEALPAPKFSVTVQPATGGFVVESSPTTGGITCGSACTASFDQNTLVTLVAQPDAGFVFAGWNGDCAGTGACQLRVTRNMSVGATFSPAPVNTFALNVGLLGDAGSGTITSNPAGINCGTACSASFNEGTPVTLTVVPTAGSAFTGWSGDCAAVPTTTTTCTVTMSQVRSVGARFNKIIYLLSITKSGVGTVTSTAAGTSTPINCGATCSTSFDAGTAVTLTATPAVGYRFSGWAGGCTGTLPNCTVNLNGVTTVRASFVQVLHTLTVSGGGTNGTVSSTPAGIACGATCTASFAEASSVSLVATPSAGFTFGGWTGDCAGTGACVVTIDANKTVGAVFNPIPPTTFSLNVSTNGNGSVASTQAGISCGATCSATFNAGTAVTLTATPAIGYSFAGWSGGCSGTALTCTVNLTANTTVTASFSQITLALAVTRAGNGTGSVASAPVGIDCGLSCLASFAFGSNVTLTASAAAGSSFGGWSGACTGTTTTCTVTLDAAKSVTASFTRNTAGLSVAKTGNGTVSSAPAGINCGTVCSATFDTGTSVTLTAAPSAGYRFAGWTGACTGSALTCTVTVNAAATVNASFTQILRTLTVNAAAGGGVASSPLGISCAPTCAASFADGTSVTLVATPINGFSFSGWGGACTGTGTCVVAMTADQTVSATFTAIAPTTFALNVATSGSGTVSSSPAGIACGATCSATFNSGATLTLTAAPAAGYSFAGWSGGGCSGTALTCAITLSANTTVTASFTQTVYAINVTKSGTGSGTVTSTPAGINCGATCAASFAAGGNLTLTATPAAGSSFTGWGGACTGSASTCVVPVDSARSVSATFSLASYTLGVTTVGTGTVTSTPAGINCGATCSASLASGTSVTLTATPAAGWSFTGWSGAGCTGSSTCTVTMTAAQAVTATFAAIQYDIQLAWAASTDTTVVGYRVYHGVASGNYEATTQSVTAPQATFGPVTSGTTHYFAVSAVDAAGNESPRSAEISVLVP